ncbi:Protein FAM72A [Hypsizygus marmoreus]|uniref:Protein FAM72A n=1 Tax=Hypsizygus marmoreus TaxID=39966 RepID=A0A369JUL9_HYPMA|nr:Protein FAM72A [Hypsizygus marmoreus]
MPAPTSSNPRTYSDPRPQRDPPFVHVLYDNNHNLSFHPPISPSAMLGYLAHTSRMQNQLHLFPSNPYPTPPPPPPIPHKVWILDCKSCGTFLTNRGMKAVLLLRPNVSLYSSDALPVNCSAYTSNPDALRPRTSCRPNTSSHIPPRTCECLTQTLCCHGCGATVGYMIVIPCARCTSSITATNRATNGHRFVFHSSEIAGTERHYVEDEPGVIPYEPVVPTPLASESSTPQFTYPPVFVTQPDPRTSNRTHGRAQRSRSSSPSLVPDYLPTPSLEFADPILASSTPPQSDSYPFPRAHHYSEPYPSPQGRNPVPHSVPPFRPISPPASIPSQYGYHLASRPTSAASSQPSNSSPPPLIHSSFSFSLPAEQKELPPPRKLQLGDVLYWHHLARNGEIPGVAEDERARGTTAPTSAGGKITARMDFSR